MRSPFVSFLGAWSIVRIPRAYGDFAAGGDLIKAEVRCAVLRTFFRFTQHIPVKGSHLIRYYGWYSNKNRGLRKNAAAAAAEKSSLAVGAVAESRGRCSQSWAM